MDSHRSLLEARERRIVEIVFRSGLLLSLLAMTAGLAIWFASGSPALAAVDLTHLEDMSNPSRLMGIGIGILAATPAANIVALMLLWIRRHQPRLTSIALTVMLTLVAATVLGQG